MDPIVCGPTATIQDIREIKAERGFGGIPITGRLNYIYFV